MVDYSTMGFKQLLRARALTDDEAEKAAITAALEERHAPALRLNDEAFARSQADTLP